MPQTDLKKLEAAYTRLGEAVIDPSRWPSLMEAISEATQTTGAVLFRSDVQSLDVPMTASVVDMVTGYFEENFHLGDIRAVRGVPLLLQGRKAIGDQHIFRSETEMLRNRLYAHLERFGFRWWSAVPFHSGSAMWVIALQRKNKEGMFEQGEIEALNRLCAPLTEVATLSRLVGQQVLAGTLHTMASINQPALSLSGSGAVIETNALADTIFDSDFGVQRGFLFVKDHEAQQSIRARILKRVISSDATLPEADDPDETIIVRRANKRPLLVRMLPVHGAARSPFLGARFILTLRDLENERLLPIAVLARIYSLTPMETKVAAFVARGYSPQEIAQSLHSSRDTVRSQIKAVFNKTDTHRQNELAALLLRMQP